MAINRNTDGFTPASSLLRGCDVLATDQSCAECDYVAFLMEQEQMLRLLPLALGQTLVFPALCLN